AVLLEISLGGRLAHAIRLLRDRLLEREQVGERAGGGLPDRRRLAEIAMLLEQRHAERIGLRDHAARWLHLTRDQAEERRLAGAVAPDDAPALARADGERDVVE